MNSKNTKRALVTSALAMLVCVAMLIGSTFAWFTDTATTGVNRIQAGNLDIKLFYANNATGENADWTEVNADTKLNFLQKQADGSVAQGTDIYWEPGCTYSLPALKVVNNGNLALKYKIVITGIQGSAKLNKVIDWTMKLGDTDFVMGSEHKLAAKTADGESSDIFTVSGTMQTSAGNEYMREKIDGINITVYATQDAVESDSFGNDYDKNADGTPQFDTWYDNVATTAAVNSVGDTVIKDKDSEPTVQATVPKDSTAATTLTLIKNEAATPSNITVETGTKALTAEVKLIDQDGNKVSAKNGKFFTVSLAIGKALNVVGFYHSGTALTKAADANSLTANDMYFYDTATGYVTFTTDDFSPFTAVVSDSVFSGGDGSKAHPYLVATGEQASQMENAKGYFKFINDVVVTDEIYLSGKTVVIDLNGHSVKLDYADGVKPNNGSVFYIGGKKSSLTINDSSEGQTGAVIGSDKTYTNKVTSAVRAGNYGKLTINGGHFYGMSEGTSCIFVYTSMSSGSKATVTINGGKFETASPSNGTYFVLNHQDNATGGCTITVNGGSFKNYNPGVTEVDPVNAKTGKIVLGTGASTSSAEIDGAVWYTVSK